MQALRIVMLLVALAVGYLLFFRLQPQPAELPPADLTHPEPTTQTVSGPTPRPHSQYKEAMDRAHAVADKLEQQRKEDNVAY